MAAPTDRHNAFCPHGHITIVGNPHGALQGLTFAVKDVIDVANVPTGAGNPDWLATHDHPGESAHVVNRLLLAGATLTGKTLSDELAFSLTGMNQHYGTPRNPRAPGRIPGGSSSGSASAVAEGAVDFALGTDTAGSVRIPAALCGLYGFRPTHARVSMAGIVPLAPSFDTVGWLTRSPEILIKVGEALLDTSIRTAESLKLILLMEAFELADTDVSHRLLGEVEDLKGMGFEIEQRSLAPLIDLATCVDVFRTLEEREIWQTHGEWIRKTRPTFARDVSERFESASEVTAGRAEEAHRKRVTLRAELDELLRPDIVLFQPTSPCIAPRLDATSDELLSFRRRSIALGALAGLAGLPQVTLPVGEDDSAPVGLSLIARRFEDERLLWLAGVARGLSSMGL